MTFLCRNGMTRVALSRLMDGMTDCPDRSGKMMMVMVMVKLMYFFFR